MCPTNNNNTLSLLYVVYSFKTNRLNYVQRRFPLRIRHSHCTLNQKSSTNGIQDSESPSCSVRNWFSKVKLSHNKSTLDREYFTRIIINIHLARWFLRSGVVDAKLKPPRLLRPGTVINFRRATSGVKLPDYSYLIDQ